MRKSILFFLGICLSAAGLADCNEEANQARKDQHLDEAKKDYNRATELDRTYARAHTRLTILRIIPFLPLLLVASLG